VQSLQRLLPGRNTKRKLPMLKVSGYWLIATSIIHVLVGLLVFNEPRKRPNGWFNAVAPNFTLF